MRRSPAAMLALLLACAAWLAPSLAAATITPWTGLVYIPNAPPPNTALRALHDGKNALRNDMPATAKGMLQKAISLDPTLAEAHFWLAGAHRALKEGPMAQTELKKALALDPGLQAHAGELDRFGSATALPPAKPVGANKSASQRCDDLYATCRVSATRCNASGCQTDFGRMASCTSEHNQCLQRN